MAYKALYRTYRPQTFEEVVGQDTIVKTLQNSIINNKIGHAYLFCGPRGTGKTSIARIFAKTLNCPNAKDAKPCNECSICNEITTGTSPDVIEIDAASNNGVDEIRELRDKVKFLPAGTKYKVYIIDEVHMLSTSAFNALLKTLEEPPAHAIFILATTEPNKVLPTIISRCQRYDFKALTNNEIYNRLELVCNNENIKFEEDALMSIAIAADGGMRDALSLLDQAISLCDDVINDEVASSVTGTVDKSNLLNLARAIESKNISDALKMVTDLQNNGRDTQKTTTGLLGFYRDILMAKANISDDIDPRYRDFADNIDIRKVYFNIDALNDVQSKIRLSNTPRIYLEVGLIKMISASSEELDYGKRLLDLEQKLENYSASDSGSGDVVDSRRLRLLEEKFSNLLNELSKMELHKFNDRIKVLEDNNGSTSTSIDDASVKQLDSKVNKIVEDIELLKVTQESLRTQVDNTAVGGIDDDVLTEKIEENLKKVKPTINYSEIEAFVNRKLEDFTLNQDNSNIDSSSNNQEEIGELSERLSSLEELDNKLNEEIKEINARIINISRNDVARTNEPSEVITREIVTYDDNKIKELESRIEELRLSRQNVPASGDNDYQEDLNHLEKRIDELEEIILSMDKDEATSKESTYVPTDIEDRLAKMESNIYKIMSGMLNPQPAKKIKQRVDEKQISLWSEDIVDFGKVEHPLENTKTDFEDFAKPVSEVEKPQEETTFDDDVEVENESTDHEEVLEDNNENEIVHDDLFDNEYSEDESDEIEESSYVSENEGIQNESVTYVNDTLDNQEESIDEIVDESNDEAVEEENLFIQEEFTNETVKNTQKEETIEDDYVPLFEENLEDYYSNEENNQENNITEEQNDVNLFDENSGPVQDNEIELEEKRLEEERLEQERIENEKKQELERIEAERKAQEDRLHAEAMERERERARLEMEQKREEIEKIEAARASGGEDLDEYERYDVKVLERIFSDERNPEYYGEKGRLERVWKELLRLAPLEKRGVAEILAEGRVSDVGNHEFIILFSNAAICNQVMSRPFKKVSLKLLYDILGTDYNYMAITQEVYLEKRSEYASQYAVGTKYPVLSPITDPNLRVVVEKDDSDGESMIRKTMDVFGDKLNVK